MFLLICFLLFTVFTPAGFCESESATMPVIDVTADLVKLGISPVNAVGDGETDDSEPIQTAIDYAFELGEGRIVVPPGVYRVSQLTVKPGVQLIGAGRGQTIFRARGTKAVLTPVGGMMAGFTAYGTPTEDVSGDNWKPGKGGVGRGGTATAVHVIYIRDSEDVHIHDIEAFEGRYDALYTRGSKGLRISDSYFDRAGRNVVSMVGPDEDFVFSNCYFGSLWGLYHVDIEPNNPHYVRDGVFLNCVFDGRNAGDFETDTWGRFFIFCGGKELENHSVSVIGCKFYDINIRIRGVFPDCQFLYNTFNTIHYPAFYKVRTNPVGEFRNVVIRGNQFYAGENPMRNLSYVVAFTGESVIEGNWPYSFNDAEIEQPGEETDWGEEDHPVAQESSDQ